MNYIFIIALLIFVIWFTKDMVNEKEDRNDNWTDIHQTDVNNVFPYWFWLIWGIAMVGFLLYALTTF
tara:strand:- start:253 stop:453 length:201 start_codon:yes stop_codon:yes gene_type:complete